jgi:hypothetical protein
MGLDEASGRVILVIDHDGPWDGSDQQLFLLQEKLNAYLSFALDGEMTDACPDFSGRPLGLRIDSAIPPDPRTLHLLGHVRQQIAFQDITLELATEPAPNCGPTCGCH